MKKHVFIGGFLDQPFDTGNEALNAFVNEYKSHIDLKLGEVTTLHANNFEYDEVIVIGLGEKAQFGCAEIKEAASKIKLGKADADVLMKSFLYNVDCEPDIAVPLLITTVNDFNYSFSECYGTKPAPELGKVTFVKVSADCKRCDELINESLVISESVNHTRNLVNKPYNYLNAVDLANYAKQLAKQLNVEATVLGKKELEALKAGAFLGVNKGSEVEPQLINLKYFGNPKSKTLVSLVGKGLMFDTGGYSIKTDNYMVNMKSDMAGAATVLGAFEAVVKNKLPVNVQVVIAATDNKIKGEALLPDDVITTMNGKTIEIVSTDAEGRLTLADALCYAQSQNSNYVIDLATLTGAVVRALGSYTTGVFGNNDEFTQTVLASSKAVQEAMWELPITADSVKAVRGSKVADLSNGPSGVPGASSAAAFLQEFINPETKWVHLDIAGTAFRTSPKYGEFYGASGEGLKTLYHFLKNFKA